VVARHLHLPSRNPNATRILKAAGAPAAAGAGAAVILLSGLPGVGKSTFARALGAATDAIILESDRLRALLFEAPVHSPRESGILFRAIRSAAACLLKERHAVIIDATNLSETDRRPFYELADSSGAPLFVVALDAPQETIEGRLARRLLESDGCSYADIDVYHRMRGRVEPISREHMRVDTSNQAAVQTARIAITTAYREAVGKGIEIH
jgi:predicted kinase